VLDGLAVAAPELKVTIDPVENRNFEYHTGISFTFFAASAATFGPVGELGRGGRYEAGDLSMSEPATGFTLYADTILRTLPKPAAPRRLLLPYGTDRAGARRLREAGWVTIAMLEPARYSRAEARRMRCSHILENGEPVALS
jgi:ATP phosphoribosyltransferase regulatory subunit